MTQPLRIDAAAEHESAVLAVAALHGKLKLQNAFVGSVAFSAWTGKRVEAGAVDLLAMLSPERMRQVPMMASNHGFRVDPEEIERAEELDLIPLNYQQIRIHVLMASNALYGRMVADSVAAVIGETSVSVAFSAWTGRRVEARAVDLLAMLSPERMRQVPMMASNHGFRVDPQEVERGEELDLKAVSSPTRN